MIMTVPSAFMGGGDKLGGQVKILESAMESVDDSPNDTTSVIEMDRCSEWTEVRDVNPKFYNRTGHTMSSVRGNLYIFGGTDYKVPDCYGRA